MEWNVGRGDRGGRLLLLRHLVAAPRGQDHPGYGEDLRLREHGGHGDDNRLHGIISPSIPLTDGIAGLTALVALQWFVAYASSRSGRFYWITTNTPRLLYDGSRFLDENLRAERITREDVKTKIWEGGHPNLESVAAVVLESTGNVAIIGSSVPAEPAESLMGPVARHREGERTGLRAVPRSTASRLATGYPPNGVRAISSQVGRVKVRLRWGLTRTLGRPWDG